MSNAESSADQNLMIIILGLLMTIFLPIMRFSAPSLGCRFSDIRLDVVVTGQVADLFCVLHPIEVLLFFLGLGLTVLIAINMWQESGFLPFDERLGLVLSLVLLGIPFVDLSVLGVLGGPFNYDMVYQFAIGYYFYGLFLGFLFYTIIEFKETGKKPEKTGRLLH